MTESSQLRACFLEQYRQVRHAEGRGSQDPAYYRALPYADLSGKNSAMWVMRARTYRSFEKILRGWECAAPAPFHVLDLGAGNCWMSYRLGLRGHCSIALDIFNDPLDGLRAARFYPITIPIVEADFSSLPFDNEKFDLVIFNASFHYSVDYSHTLREVRRCLRPDGRLVILDSPIYRRSEHGRRMVEERKATFRERYGFASDVLNSTEFLDEPALCGLGKEFNIQWETYRPWYGWRWHLRPLIAMVKKRRPPSAFRILVGRFGSR